ncbi:MAG: sigma-70 family RNA polymerase sigma factor [Syntrophorhabdaceae bacterium]|nr:sigma-70 family RNA polymerase sigma factor [Syntrophorhabdaceae bacterium]
MRTPQDEGAPVDLLVEAFRQGKPDAFEAIVRTHQNRVYAFCVRMLSDREEALDISQDVFISAYKKLDTFRGDSSLSTWLLRIATNRCLNSIRRKKSIAAKETPWPTMGDYENETEFLPVAPEEHRPDRITENMEMGSILSEALGRLNPSSRWMVLLSDVEGFSHDEIAELAEVPIGTVKSRLHRARMTLRKTLYPVI